MSPSHNKGRTAVVAVHNAFKEDESRVPKGFVLYQHTMGLRQVMNLGGLELHRDAFDMGCRRRGLYAQSMTCIQLCSYHRSTYRHP